MNSYPYSVKEVVELFYKYDIYIVQRKDNKNQRFIERVDKTTHDAEEFIRNEINEKQCVKELINDRDYPGNYLYVFKSLFINTRCYIKLTIDERSRRIVVISFHEDEVKKNEKY